MKQSIIALISILFLILGFGTASGFYSLNLFGLNLLGMDSDVSLIITILGVLGLLYLYARKKK